MRLILLNGSPRQGSTHKILSDIQAKLTAPGVEIELMSLAGKKVAPCNACDYCKRQKTNCCVHDDMEELFPQFVSADAFVVASPVYVMGPTPQLSAFFSRLRPVHHVYPGMLRNKISGSIAVGGTRNGGQELTVSILNNYLLTRGLIVVGSEIGNYHGGKIWSQDSPDRAVKDTIGLETAYGVVRRVIEIAKYFSK
ncbi:flavodoxin family protein [Paradesulfitobacterium ferrireducens]|uniref:flavodoxin family protein n=1 Tax=Paradesulfitobacterium ferrireducens TaxID=2816476 RepID=UPI001A8FDE07|nr:flavodoxin family protein [Paradesulfitobacterium ferrireducens]